MKTDHTSLLWGTIIGVALVAAIMVLPSEFSNLRVPFTDMQAEMSLVSAVFFGILIAAYRKLWKIIGFWILLLALLGAHVALYLFFIQKVAKEFFGFRIDIFYGVISGVEFAVFALIVALLYRKGPKVPSWIGLGSR